MITRPSARSTAPALDIDAELLREAILLAERVDRKVKEWAEGQRVRRSTLAESAPGTETETLPQPT